MKKKAIISTVAGIMLAGVMCVGFAACGDTAKSIKGEEVNEETWNAAFTNADLYKNFKLEGDSETVMEMKLGDKTVKITMETSGTYTYADQKTYGVGESKTSISGDLPDEMKDYYKEETKETEYYVDESGETTKYIEKVDGKWAETSTEYQSGLEAIQGILRGMIGTEPDFADYEYSSEHKGYVLKEEEAEEGELIVIKFKDGKIKAIYAEATGEEDGSKMTYTISYVMTYDGQSVTIPTVA